MESVKRFMHSFDTRKCTDAHSTTCIVVFVLLVLVFIVPPDNVQLLIGCLGAFMYVVMRPAHPATKKKTLADIVTKSHGYSSECCTSYPPSNGRSRTRAQSGAMKFPVRQPEVKQESRVPVVQYALEAEGFESQVQELLKQIEPDAQSERAVERIVQSVKKSVQHILPEADIVGICHARVSRASAFSVAVPEVDIVVTTSMQELIINFQERLPRNIMSSNFDTRKAQKSATRTIADRLVGNAGFKFRRSGFKCDEPKVTLMAPHVEGCVDPIPLDLSINSKTALYNSAIMEECGEIDPRAVSLIVLVKRWAKDRGICHAAKGHLPPYGWTLLVVYFLQVGIEAGSLIPPLLNRAMLARVKKRSKGEMYVSSIPRDNPQEVAAGMSVAALFTEFLKFYQGIDWNVEVACVRTGRRAEHQRRNIPLHVVPLGKNRMQAAPSIEDPFEHGRNIGAVMNEMSIVRLDAEITRANELISVSAPLVDLFKPWEPACGPVSSTRGGMDDCDDM
jgi:hypothetical protein